MAMFDEIGNVLTSGGTLERLAESLGTDPSGTTTAAAAAVPLLLGGLQRRSVSPTSAEALYQLISANDGAILDMPGGPFSTNDTSGLGSTLVGAVLGSQRQAVESTLASSSGLAVGSIARFLPLLAPVVIGYLGRKQTHENLDRDTVAAALATERQVLEDVGFGQWLGLLDGGDPVDDENGFKSSLAKIAGLGGLGVLAGSPAPAPVPASTAAVTSTPSTPTSPDSPAGSAETTRPSATATGVAIHDADPGPAPGAAPTASGTVADVEPNFGAPSSPGWVKWLLPLALLVLLTFLLWSCLSDEDTTTTASPDFEGTTAIDDSPATSVAAEPSEVADAAPPETPSTPEPADDGREEPIDEPAPERIPGVYIPGRILGTAQDSAVFETLLAAVESAGLAGDLETDGPFTVLAPIDPAFELLSDEFRDRILDDPELLLQILSYHVIDGEIRTADSESGEIIAFDGSTLYLDTAGFQPKVNGATVLDTDLETENGLIQVIDRLLIPPRLLATTGLTVNQALSLPPVQFEVGSAELTDKGRAVLDGAANYLAAIPEDVEIGGHTDDEGADEANLELSQERADAVLEYLIGLGVDGDRLSAVGYGETEPFESNDTPTGAAANRRIEFTITS